MICDVEIYNLQPDPMMPGTYNLQVKGKATPPAPGTMLMAEAKLFRTGATGSLGSASMSLDATLPPQWWSCRIGPVQLTAGTDVIYARVDANWSYMVNGSTNVNSAPVPV